MSLTTARIFRYWRYPLAISLPFRIVIQIVEAQHTVAFAGQREFGIEGSPVDLVAQFECGQDNPLLFQLGEQRFEVSPKFVWVRLGKRMSGHDRDSEIYCCGTISMYFDSS
jgi:hypothetical protein